MVGLDDTEGHLDFSPDKTVKAFRIVDRNFRKQLIASLRQQQIIYQSYFANITGY